MSQKNIKKYKRVMRKEMNSKAEEISKEAVKSYIQILGMSPFSKRLWFAFKIIMGVRGRK